LPKIHGIFTKRLETKVTTETDKELRKIYKRDYKNISFRKFLRVLVEKFIEKEK